MPELIFEGRHHTLSDLRTRGHAMACDLAEHHGVGNDSTVLLTLEFSDTAIELLFATWFLRARCVMLPPTCSRALFQSVQETFSPQAVFVDSENARLRGSLASSPDLGDAPADLGNRQAKHITVYSQGTSRGTAAGPSLLQETPTELANLLPEQPKVVFFTSGSTSQAKGVVLDWELIRRKGVAVLEHYHADENDRVMPVLPYSHVYGLYPVLGAFSTGVDTIICRETVAPGEIAKAISRDVATIVICPPLTAQFLFGRHAPAEEVQQSLRIVAMGGAAMPSEVLKKIIEHLPSTQILLSYGLAETYSTICCVDVSAEPDGFASVGPARFLAEVQARNPETGQQVASDEIGELCIGGQITPGYFGKDHSRDKYFTSDGWLRTGDLGTVDERGYVQIRGRLKETINAGGLSIDPSEIEEVLNAHPLVTDCGVFGHVRSNREFPVAAVVIDTSLGKDRDEKTVIEELFAHCREHLSSKLVPGKIAIVDGIPRGALGKIERANLKKQVL